MEEFLPLNPTERVIEWSWEEKDYDSSLSLNDNLDKSKALKITNLNRVNENTLYYLFLKKFFDEVDTDCEANESFNLYHCIEEKEIEKQNKIWLLVVKQNDKLYVIDLQKSLE